MPRVHDGFTVVVSVRRVGARAVVVIFATKSTVRSVNGRYGQDLILHHFEKVKVGLVREIG